MINLIDQTTFSFKFLIIFVFKEKNAVSVFSWENIQSKDSGSKEENNDEDKKLFFSLDQINQGVTSPPHRPSL